MKDIDAKKLYNEGTDYQFHTKEVLMGPWTSLSYMNDPKHMAFVLSRYKFCAKMLEGKKVIMEVGCGDGIGLPIVAKEAQKIYAVDWDKRLLEGIYNRMPHLTNIEYVHADMNQEAVYSGGERVSVDAIFTIDVLEHVNPANESFFMENMISSLNGKQDGVMIVGTPNKTAADYASPQSAVQHCNLKTMQELKELMEKYFYNVFMFGMNDEVLHTGYAPMCHYIWAVGAGVKI